LGFTDYNIHQEDIIQKAEYQVKHVWMGEFWSGDSAIVYGITSSAGKGVLLLGFQQTQIMKLVYV
jgi:hypothetical protein